MQKPKITITEVYQQITKIMDALDKRDVLIADARSEFCTIAARAAQIGAVIVVPTAEELQERYKQLSVFESSEEVDYEESYESSNC
jgi:2-keto-4-pentenoate hydratase